MNAHFQAAVAISPFKEISQGWARLSTLLDPLDQGLLAMFIEEVTGK